MIRINNFRGDLTDVLATTATLQWMDLWNNHRCSCRLAYCANDSFDTRAKKLGLTVPLPPPTYDPTHKEAAWDGRAFQLVRKGSPIGHEATHFCQGEFMVGQCEVPCSNSTRLIGGKYRSIGVKSNVKEANEWKPGNRLNARVWPSGSTCNIFDCDVDLEYVFSVIISRNHARTHTHTHTFDCLWLPFLPFSML